MTEKAVPARVGVIGGGRMGVGIAHAFLLAGASVTVLERDAVAADHAAAGMDRAIAVSVDRGTTDEDADLLRSRRRTALRPAELAGCGLVVEAVPENLSLKVDMLRRVEVELADDAWLASNTSSLPIDRLADGLSRPGSLCGLHFFNPVPASALVEVVEGARSRPELVDAARGWVAAMGKTPIVVRDSPGFASSRLGVVIALEAMRMLEEGVASAEDIDLAMVLGYRFPVGPLQLTDLVGLDVRLDIAEHLERELGDRFAPPQVLRDKVAIGELGRKTGQGFFPWPS